MRSLREVAGQRLNHGSHIQGTRPRMAETLTTESPTTKGRPASAEEVLPSAATGVDWITRHRTILLLMLATAFLKTLIFPPINIWPIAYVCLVPWLLAVGLPSYAPRVYLHNVLFGLIFFAINARWMIPATGYGYMALVVYLMLYMPFLALPVRHVVRRRRWPLALAFPVIWVGGEMIKAVALSGFPWFFLSHSQYRVLPLTQISDLVGAYGVSFIVASVNGLIADLLIARLAGGGRLPLVTPLVQSRSRLRLSWAATGLMLLLALTYGGYQLSRNTLTKGPRVAVVQGDFLDMVNNANATGRDAMSPRDRMLTYVELIEAAGEESPDIIALPETPWPMVLNKEARGMGSLSRASFSALQQLSTRLNAYIVTGCASFERHPYDLLAKDRYFNSAAVFHPDGREPGRYDKCHLVYFGETVPFRFTRLHGLYLWLNSLMPFSGADGKREYSIFRGDEFRRFDVQPPSMDGAAVRFGIPICYEDVMPYISRAFARGDDGGKAVDFLVNISNDGWFGRGIQQEQHLAICTFRAVENRVGIARAVNTGNSALIKPTGEISARPSDLKNRWDGEMGYAVDYLYTDSRNSFYSHYGDWFAWSCALLLFLSIVDYWVVRLRSRAEQAAV